MKTFTELEIIEFLKNKGLEVTQNQTKYFETKGIIKSGDSLNSFIKTIEQVFESVEVSGRGKKRVYTVGSELEEVVKRKDGRENNTGTRQLSEEEKELMIYVADNIQIKNLSEKTLTLGTWAKELGFHLKDNNKFSTSFREQQELIERKLSLTNEEFFHSIVVVSEFNQDYNRKVKQMIHNTFNRLKREEVVNVEEIINGSIDSEFKESDINTYNRFMQRQKELIEETGYSYKKYMIFLSQYRNFKVEVDEATNEDVKRATVFNERYKVVTDTLIKEFGFEFMFKSYKVELLKENENAYLWTDEMVEEIFNEHFLKQTKTYKYKNYKENYVESTYFHRAFFYLNATILLNAIDTEVMANFEQDLIVFYERFHNEYISKTMNNFGGLELIQKRNEYFNNREFAKLNREKEIIEMGQILVMEHLENVDIDELFIDEEKERKRKQWHDDLEVESYGIANLLLDKAIEQEENEYWHSVFN